MGVVARRFEIYLAHFDPTVGSEIRKTRPCVVVSPDEMNENIQTVIVAPMTTKVRGYSSRLPCVFDGKRGEIALDQLRAVDPVRLVKRLGKLTSPQAKASLDLLKALFAE